MPEIKRPIIKLSYGQEYIAGHETYVITEDNTISDVARFIISQGWDEDLIYLINEELNA